MENKRPLSKGLKILAMCGLVWIAYAFFLDTYLLKTGTLVPDPNSGRIYLESIHHGQEVYVTYADKLQMEWLAVPMLLMVAIGFFLVYRYRKSRV
jgi:hypothetical protein